MSYNQILSFDIEVCKCIKNIVIEFVISEKKQQKNCFFLFKNYFTYLHKVLPAPLFLGICIFELLGTTIAQDLEVEAPTSIPPLTPPFRSRLLTEFSTFGCVTWFTFLFLCDATDKLLTSSNFGKTPLHSCDSPV